MCVCVCVVHFQFYSLPMHVNIAIWMFVYVLWYVCFGPNSRLGLHLPHRVQPDTSKARWLSDKEILEVTLKSNREYDFMNY